MQRDVSKLIDTTFDVVVVGAGIYGACIAAELGKAGYQVALLESNDFGAQTSANNLGVLHGGLCHFQHFDIKRLKRSLTSRHYFMRLAPHLINIVPFQKPLTGRGLKSPWVTRIIFWLYDLLADERNQQVPSNIHLPRCSVRPISVDTKGWFSDKENLKAVGIWHEAILTRSPRMVFEMVMLAHQYGVQIANYCSATRLIINGGNIQGVRIKDRLSKQYGVLKTRWVIDASGRHTSQLRFRGKSASAQRNWVRAVNILIKDNIIGDYAVAFGAKDSHKNQRNKTKQNPSILLAVPNTHGTVIGTFYDQPEGKFATLKLSAENKNNILKKISRYHSDLNIRNHDIVGWQQGWLPALPTKLSDASFIPHSRSMLKVFLENSSPSSGLLEVKGVKFAIAPAVAKDVLEMMRQRFDSTKSSPSLSEQPASIYPTRRMEKILYARYGKKWFAVKQYLLSNPRYVKPIHKQISLGEVGYACEHEMALRLSDIMHRRFDIQASAAEQDDLAKQISKIMQHHLGWSDARRQKELLHFRSLNE